MVREPHSDDFFFHDQTQFSWQPAVIPTWQVKNLSREVKSRNELLVELGELQRIMRENTCFRDKLMTPSLPFKKFFDFTINGRR